MLAVAYDGAEDMPNFLRGDVMTLLYAKWWKVSLSLRECTSVKLCELLYMKQTAQKPAPNNVAYNPFEKFQLPTRMITKQSGTSWIDDGV